jgi:transposase, IS6 family
MTFWGCPQARRRRACWRRCWRSASTAKGDLRGGIGELLPAAWHRTDRYANNHIEADHGRLKSRLSAMRGFKQDRSARIVIAGYAFLQNVRRGHYELAEEWPTNRRVAVAFDELALAI